MRVVIVIDVSDPAFSTVYADQPGIDVLLVNGDDTSLKELVGVKVHHDIVEDYFDDLCMEDG